jgi:16S rRNA (guanine966-N2)-methyltransferase
MRIITGEFKGRNIMTVGDLSVRPATDRVRQTIFNMLATRIDLEGAAVLDLFAGSGSLGLEALSRGAARTTFVEAGTDPALYIEKNIAVYGCGERAEVVEMDALRFVALGRGPYDLVFADPPYGYPKTATIPGELFSRGMIRPGGYLIIEHASDLHFEGTPAYTAGPEKKFGRTLVTFFQPTNGRSSPP